jgi:hypothetical protein
MGDILVDFGKDSTLGKPSVYIERRVDDVETQKLHFRHDKDSWLSTETGNSIHLFGRDEFGNTIEVEIPIGVRKLKEALDRYLEGK